MDKNKILSARSDRDLTEVLLEMNDEIERLIKFAKNVNTFKQKIYPELVDIGK